MILTVSHVALDLADDLALLRYLKTPTARRIAIR
jgi:hypothetical protein